MEAMLFRVMEPSPDGLPLVGRSARRLGVRVPHDIPQDAGGYVHPGTGGMSVAPSSMWNLPNHRRPKGMGRGSSGPADDRVYAIEEMALRSQPLDVRVDPNAPAVHAFVEPSMRMPLARYDTSLENTRISWGQAWP